MPTAAHRDGPQPHAQRPQVDPHVQQVDQRVGAVGGVQHGALPVAARARLEGLGQQAGLQVRARWAAPAYTYSTWRQRPRAGFDTRGCRRAECGTGAVLLAQSMGCVWDSRATRLPSPAPAVLPLRLAEAQ